MHVVKTLYVYFAAKNAPNGKKNAIWHYELKFRKKKGDKNCKNLL